MIRGCGVNRDEEQQDRERERERDGLRFRGVVLNPSFSNDLDYVN
jgi:hypothetical protein